jgi:inactive dipeptidyl peptidase 10
LSHFSFLYLFSNQTGVFKAKTYEFRKTLYETEHEFKVKHENLAFPQRRSYEIHLQRGTRADVNILYPPSWREELRDAAFPVIVEV